MGYTFGFDDTMFIKGDKLLDKFKMPQLQKFDGIEGPRIHFNQYSTSMSITKDPLPVLKTLFVLSFEGKAVNQYHRLKKSIRADWKKLCTTFLMSITLSESVNQGPRVNQKTKGKLIFFKFLNEVREQGRVNQE